MEVSANTLAAGTATTAAIPENNSKVDKDAFLNLLVAQLKNQDPLDPASNEEFMGQLAQMEELENSQNQITALNDMTEQLSLLLNQQSMLSASSLLGSQVKTSDSNGMTTGIVDKVSVVDGQIKLAVDGYKKLIGEDGIPHDKDIETTVAISELTEVAVPKYDTNGDWIR